MEGIEKITAKIAQDAQAEISRLMAEADEKVGAIQAEARAQAQREAAEIEARGRSAVSSRALSPAK